MLPSDLYALVAAAYPAARSERMEVRNRGEPVDVHVVATGQRADERGL